jgi:hypothetical protein
MSDPLDIDDLLERALKGRAFRRAVQAERRWGFTPEVRG